MKRFREKYSESPTEHVGTCSSKVIANGFGLTKNKQHRVAYRQTPLASWLFPGAQLTELPAR